MQKCNLDNLPNLLNHLLILADCFNYTFDYLKNINYFRSLF